MLVLRGFWCAWLLKCLIFCVGASDVLCSYVDYRQLPQMTTSTQHELPSGGARGKPRRNRSRCRILDDPTIVSHRRPPSTILLTSTQDAHVHSVSIMIQGNFALFVFLLLGVGGNVCESFVGVVITRTRPLVQKSSLAQQTATVLELDKKYSETFHLIDECAASGQPSIQLYDAVRYIDKNALRLFRTSPRSCSCGREHTARGN